MNVFINGVSAKIGGGKNILDNFILALKQKNTNHTYYILTPSNEDYKKFSDAHIKFVDVPEVLKKGSLFFIFYFFFLPIVLKKNKINVIINFADIVIPTKIKQIYFFDWSYAVYDEAYLWKGMSSKELIMRKLKVFLIKKYISDVKVVLCQTKNIKKRLKERFNLRYVKVIHTPVSFLENKKENKKIDLEDNRYKLFYPANSSIHKNHKFVIDFLQKIEDSKLPFLVITTLDSESFESTYGQIEESLNKHIKNIGRVNLEDMPSIYKNIDALFFPSILETYGIPYVEAMYFKKPIATSDLDFAKDLCGDAAVYFDPFKSESAVEKIVILQNDLNLRRDLLIEGSKKLLEIPSWNETIKIYEKLIETI